MRTFLIALCAFAAGCATLQRPTALTQADVISMVKAGLTDEDVMRRIDASGTVFHLSGDDVVRLRKEGLSDRLVTFMMDTYTRAALEDQRRQEMHRWHFHYGWGWGPPWW
jgi:hypothetical protein